MNAPTRSAPVLELRGLNVNSLRAPQTVIAAAVHWSVAPGEFWVIGAQQHSGKTDFLLTLAGLIPPAAGEIYVPASAAAAPAVGFVFDGGQLLNSLTIAENLALPLRYHTRQSDADIAARVNLLLAVTELSPWANVSPANVPRNWQQRAGLARALALPPAVLLLDSPFTGLDARHLAWWRELLAGLARGHDALKLAPITLLATADDLRPWRGLATHVACLHRGELIILGDWAAVTPDYSEGVATLLRD
jgi:ABC-type sulfate/molybdate transport systems ATPase subunit